MRGSVDILIQYFAIKFLLPAHHLFLHLIGTISPTGQDQAFARTCYLIRKVLARTIAAAKAADPSTMIAIMRMNDLLVYGRILCRN